jgi:hypothetical protein
MGDFYSTDPLLKQLRDALRPDTKAASLPSPLVRLDELQKTIEVGVRDAERFYTLTSHAKCALCLQAAKANQVALLGKIDDTPESDLHGDKLASVRGSCLALGDALTRMMMQVESLVKARKADVALFESDDDMPLPASPGIQDTPKDQIRSLQKRAQGGQDSPVMTHTSPKRQRIAAPTATTAATITAPQSPPAYRPVPHQALAPDAEDTGSGSTGTDRTTQSPRSPSARWSPQKRQALRSQPRPRQFSARHAAQPVFTGLPQDSVTPVKPGPLQFDSSKPDANPSDQRT